MAEVRCALGLPWTLVLSSSAEEMETNAFELVIGLSAMEMIPVSDFESISTNYLT